MSFENTRITHEDYLKGCTNHQNIQLELARENEFLQTALSNATLELHSKVFNNVVRYFGRLLYIISQLF